MERKQLLFLQINYDSNANNNYLLQLSPQQFDYTSIKHIGLKCWAIEGVTYNYTAPNAGPLYCQIKFSGDLECETISNLNNPGMIQLPLETNGGWPSGQMAISEFKFPVRKGRIQRISVPSACPASAMIPAVPAPGRNDAGRVRRITDMTDGFDRIDDPRDLERYINETSGDVRIHISDVHVTSTRSGRNIPRRESKGWSP